MIKVTSSDKDLFVAIISIAVTIGVMLALISFLGEVHGLICTVIVLIGQISFLTSRVVALERRLRNSREPSDSEHSKVAEKTV